MPELPEVEAVCRRLREEAVGHRIQRAVVLRPRIIHPVPVDEFELMAAGRRIEAVERRAKHILVRLSGGQTLHVHLRMTGNLYVTPDVRFRPESTRAYLEFPNHRGILFTDPRALGRIGIHSESESAALLQDLGPEPLSAEFTLPAFIGLAKASRKPVKLFLLDQTRIAGLGNIYAAEALFRARIHPSKPIGGLSKPRLTALHAAIVQVLQDAVQSAWNAYTGPGHFGEGESFSCFVYDREGEPCAICKRAIRRIPQGGRSTYYCPGCQK